MYNKGVAYQGITYEETKPAPQPLRLVQYFVNTRDLEEGTDRFADPVALASWLGGVALIGGSVEAREADLERAVGLREALRALLAVNNGCETGPRAIERLNDLSRSLPVKVRFDGIGEARLEERAGSVDGALGHVVGLVLCARADGTWRRLKACANPGCRWVFYDASKNHAGTWCDMAVCGNRNKSRAHRERQKAGRGSRP